MLKAIPVVAALAAAALLVVPTVSQAAGSKSYADLNLDSGGGHVLQGRIT